MKSEITITVKGATGSGKVLAANLIAKALNGKFENIQIVDENTNTPVIKARIKPTSEWDKILKAEMKLAPRRAL